MNIAKEHNQLISNLTGLARVFRSTMAAPLMLALVSCATQTAAVAATAKADITAATSRENGINYDQYLVQGKSALNSGDSTQAIENFKRALQEAGSDAAKQQEAYGNLGLAYTAASDYPTAQAYLEKARAIEQAPTWINDAYKQLLSSQKLMTTEYMAKELQAAKKIEQEQEKLLVAEQESSGAEPESSGAEPESSGTEPENSDTGLGDTRRIFKVPQSAITTAMNTEAYRPKPAAAAKPKPKIVRPKHPGPTPVASTHMHTESAETSLDIRIIFAFNSAELTPEGEKQADELGKLLQQEFQDSNKIAVLVGHSDYTGSDAYDDHLSERRAAAVKSYLVGKFPDLKGKLSERGMGKRQLLFKETDEQSQSLNRRVEVKLSRSTE